MPILSILKIAFFPLTTLFIFLLGAGYFSTLLALKMTLMQASPMIIGSLTGVFYAGLLLGSYRADAFIYRIGHMRAYALFAGILALFTLLHGLFYQVQFWMGIRFLSGIAMAGLFVVIESWLLGISTKETRGQIMSLYMIAFYGAQSIGQLFIKLGSPIEMTLFILSSVLCALSIVPILFSQKLPPSFSEPVALDFRKIIDKSLSGLSGALTSGLIMGGIYGLLPTYLTHFTTSTSKVATAMFVMTFGGMLFQYPLGKLSDLLPRRVVLTGMCLGTIAICMQISLLKESSWYFLSLITLFGGLTYALYPISVSHACDALEARDIVPASQSLLLVYSLGAMIGPFIAGYLMKYFNDAGLMFFFAGSCGLMLPFLFLHKHQQNPVVEESPAMS